METNEKTFRRLGKVRSLKGRMLVQTHRLLPRAKRESEEAEGKHPSGHVQAHFTWKHDAVNVSPA